MMTTMAAHPKSGGEFLVKEMEGRAQSRGPEQCIVIGVCTRQRNTLLRRLIYSIMAQPVPSAYRVELVVVDNNDCPTADDALNGLSGPFPVAVVHEARTGLVFARNRALDEAVMRDADWFVGLDDDEWVAPDWLPRVTAGLETMGRPVLIAPCRYVYDSRLNRFLSPAQIPVRPQGETPAVFASSNFAIQRCVFDPAYGPGLRFDMAFNESGGEDLEFFRRAKHVFDWAPASLPYALAYENWNGTRGTLRYRLSRATRNQLNDYRVLRRQRQLGIFGTRLANTLQILRRTNRQVFYGLGNIVVGVSQLPFNTSKGWHAIGAGLERLARAIAVFPFVWGAIPAAYGKKTTKDTACLTPMHIRQTTLSESS